MKFPDLDGSQPCASADPEAWFPEPDTPHETTRMAVSICKTCAFRNPCADYALHVTVHGIWGGLTENQRRHARKKMNIRAVSLASTYPIFPTSSDPA